MNKFWIIAHNDLGDKVKKGFMILLLVVIIFGFFTANKDMIRIRVLANSNSEYDQNIKKEVVDILTDEFKDIMKDVKNINTARNEINKNLDKISLKINKYLISKNVNYDYKINFGLNYFPTKELNGTTYKEGYYESVLVTLGEGGGDNWWCILFPSICLTEENANYESIFKNIFEKIFY